VVVLKRILGKKPSKPSEMVIVQLNARLQPTHRGEFFEDPLDAKLRAEALGGLPKIAAVKSLRWIDLGFCEGITREGAWELKRMRPDLEATFAWI
jgi:hypothetical protein